MIRAVEGGAKFQGGSFQILQFGVIGLLTNGALYAVYLLLTRLAFPPLVAMTITFALGVALSWLLNGLITFRARLTRRSGFRMIVAYLGAYLSNLVFLWLAVHVFSLPHQWVQLVIIILLAILLFALQKFWVFSTAL